jgi:hypothetical protein
MAMRDGDFPAALFAPVDSRKCRADTSVMEVIKFAAAIKRQQSQIFIGGHSFSKPKFRRQSPANFFAAGD